MLFSSKMWPKFLKNDQMFKNNEIIDKYHATVVYTLYASQNKVFLIKACEYCTNITTHDVLKNLWYLESEGEWGKGKFENFVSEAKRGKSKFENSKKIESEGKGSFLLNKDFEQFISLGKILL